MRVMHVINQLSGRAGAEISLRENIIGSLDSGLDHVVVVLRPSGHALAPFHDNEVPVVVPTESLSHLGAIRHVIGAIRSHEPDLVHSSLFDADLAARIAAFITATPVVSSVVNTTYDSLARRVEPIPEAKRLAVKGIDRLLARHATSAFHAISEATARQTVDQLGVPWSSIRVVPRGRRASSFDRQTPDRRERIRAELGCGARPVLINVARQEPQKGHHLLLAAMQVVVESRPDALLVLVGREGRSTPEIHRMVRELDLSPSVVRLGVRTDIPDLLAAADVFAFSSLWEGLGGAVLEAAAASLPVVAFELPALQEILGPEHPWLVDVGDAGALGSALLEALEASEDRRSDVAADQLRRFLDRYELDAVVRKMSRFYLDVHAAVTPRQRSWIHRVPRVRSLCDESPSHDHG